MFVEWWKVGWDIKADYNNDQFKHSTQNFEIPYKCKDFKFVQTSSLKNHQVTTLIIYFLKSSEFGYMLIIEVVKVVSIRFSGGVWGGYI